MNNSADRRRAYAQLELRARRAERESQQAESAAALERAHAYSTRFTITAHIARIKGVQALGFEV